MENRKDRFCRVAESRVNKIIKMLRLLGNCSRKATYQFTHLQVEQIFTALQDELDAARHRFYQEKKRFSLSKGFQLQDELQMNPHIVLKLPGEEKLVAVAFQQEDYPAIDIYLCGQEKEPELICFAEYNRERTPCQEVCVGTYQSDEEDTKYYAPYRAERHEYGT